MSETRRNYELAVHINPNLEESRIAEISAELKAKLTEAGATITFVREPERTRLSYPVAKNTNSFFGWFHFNTESAEGLPNVEEYIKLNKDILRSMILRLPSDAKRAQHAVRQTKARERMEKQAKATGKVSATPAQNEALDKELEGIIEKL